jgi:hypothetical protein
MNDETPLSRNFERAFDLMNRRAEMIELLEKENARLKEENERLKRKIEENESQK